MICKSHDIIQIFLFIFNLLHITQDYSALETCTVQIWIERMIFLISMQSNTICGSESDWEKIMIGSSLTDVYQEFDISSLYLHDILASTLE